MATKRMTKTEVPEEEKVQVTKTVKKYKDDDLIPCKSIVSGGLYVVGDVTKIPYSFADYDHVVEIEYKDLIYMIRSRSVSVFEPRFLIMDDELVAQHPDVAKLYESLYDVSDLRDVIKLPVKDMIRVIDGLPGGAKNSIKGLVATMIHNGTLDSIKKVKALDDYFGTKLLLIMAQE